MFIEDLNFIDHCIALGASGGAGFSTEVTSVLSGFEQRNQLWKNPRRSYEIGLTARSMSEWQLIRNAHMIARGQLNAFRFEDPWDHEANDNNGTGVVRYVNGAMQLGKRYVAGSYDSFRDIKKPKGTIVVQRNGSTIAATVDTTTGIVSLPTVESKTITGITKATAAVVTTSTSHGWTTGDIVAFSGIGGMGQINGKVAPITVLSGTTFSVPIDSTAYSTFTSGNAVKIAGVADTLTWDGEFDVPVRFGVDLINAEIIDRGGEYGELLVQTPSIPLIEVRL